MTILLAILLAHAASELPAAFGEAALPYMNCIEARKRTDLRRNSTDETVLLSLYEDSLEACVDVRRAAVLEADAALRQAGRPADPAERALRVEQLFNGIDGTFEAIIMGAANPLAPSGSQ